MNAQFMAIRTEENTKSINQRMFNEHFGKKRVKAINRELNLSTVLRECPNRWQDLGSIKTIDNSQE